MKPTRLLFISCAAALASTGAVLMGADPAPADDHLRTELRDATLQLRAAQSDLTAAQALQAATASEKEALAATVAALRKELTANQSTADKAANDLQTQMAALKVENGKLSNALEKTRSDVEKLNKDLQEAAARGAKLKSETIILTRKVSDLESRNLALFLTGNEILTRYQDFSLGTALSAKEPFVGLTRTRLENLIQDYQDKLSDQRAHN
jgi:chromosome segregation ATPase